MSEWKRLSPPETVAPALRDWFDSPLGAAVLAEEQRLIDRALADCFGYHLLQLGVDNQRTLFDCSRVQRCIKAGDVAAVDAGLTVQCELDALPFDTDSIDVAVVHHALEFAPSPHGVLRELQRVIVPNGRLLLLGLNPWSALGGRVRLAGQFGRRRRWHQHWLSPARMHDWLALLGFATARTEFAFHRLPLQRTAGWRTPRASQPHWLDYSPLGGAYMITAIKSVGAGIAVKPRWARMRPRLVPLPVAKPSAGAGNSAARRSDGPTDPRRPQGRP